MANGWLTDTLILLPLGGAIFIAIAPLPRLAAGLVALVVSLFEIAFWGGALSAFDFTSGAASVQLQDKATWFGELGISYHVGFAGFALWLVGMSVIVMTAAIAYAVWVGREHARAYFASMLLLTTALVGVFAAQDYLLFYVFWEAMLIPLYVLVGVWGGPGRLRATLMFFIYTMAGSLLMLASIIVLGISHGSFDMTTPSRVRQLRAGSSSASSPPSSSRRRSSRSTAGSRTPTARRLPRWPASSRAPSRRRRRTASSTSRSSTSPDRRATSARRSSCSRRSG